MPFFEDELGFIKWRERMREAKDMARAAATPDLADNIGSLMRDFPWLQPGTAYGMAKQGVTGEQAQKVANYDLYYQANETNRFGSKTPVQSAQERLMAWEKELRGQIRAEKRMKKLEEKAGTAFGPSEAANTNPARVARFGDAGLDEIKAMRRTVRAALNTGDPMTMSAVLNEMQQRSAVKEDPYDAGQSGMRFASNVGKVAKAGVDALTAVDDIATGGSGQALVRNTAVVANAGVEGLAAAQRGVVSAAGDSVQGAKNLVGMAQGQPVQQVTATPAVPGMQERRDPTRPPPGSGLSPLAILEQTQAGQALIDLVQGEPVDTGTGWLPSYESETAKAAAEASREYSPYLIGGHAWTVGRGAADFAGLEPDTTPFTIVSGSVDAWQAWQLDPANFALSALADANRARKLFDMEEAGGLVNRVNAIEDALDARAADELDETTAAGWRAAVEGDDPASAAAARAQILRDAGAHVGRRAWMRSKNPIDWLYGAGTPVIRAIAGESDPWTIYWAFNGRIPIKSDTGQNVLEMLARAETEGDVRRILASELGTSIDRIPKWRNGIMARPAPRLLSDMPGRTIDPSDVDGTARTLVNYLKLGKVPKETQQRIFNEWVMAEGRGDRYAAMDGAFAAVEAQVRAAGASEKDIARLFTRSKNEWKGSLYGVAGDTGEAKPLLLLDESGSLVPVPGPRVPTERWNSAVNLPDPAEVRRLVANPAWRWMVDNPVWGAGMALADGYQDLWKFIVLIRGAWPVRVIGDEMMRMSATGQSPFVHPMSYIAQVVGNPNDSRFFRLLEKVGPKPTEAAVTEVLEARNARLTELLDEGIDPTEARALITAEMPLPANFGKRWAAAGRRAQTRRAQNPVDIGGAPFDVNDLYGEALTARIIRDRDVPRKIYLNHFDSVGRTEETWSRGLVEELYRAFSEQVSRRALRMNTDDFLEGLWTEKWGRDARAQMAAGRDAGDPWRRVLNDRAASDQYGRQILDHLQNLHRGDQRLIDAMVTGNFRITTQAGDETIIPLTYGGHATDEAVDYGRILQSEGIGPENLKVQRAHRLSDSMGDRDLAALNTFVNGAFDFLMTKPSNYLTRSPTFRNRYWEEVERLLPSMDQATQARLRATLKQANLSGDRQQRILAKMDDVGHGKLTFDQADEILKRRSLDYTRKLLYDLHKKSQFFDAARLVFPFGEAWKEVMTTWYKIMSENPNALRRTQQIVQGAREAEFDPVTGLPTGNGEGFWRHDPNTNQEVMTYPLSGWMSQQSIDLPLIGKIGPDMPIPTPMRGATSSLNMVLSGLPGLGPVAAIPASEIVSDAPLWDSIRDVVFPFGEPEGAGPWDKFLNALKSNWGKKVERAAADPRLDTMKGNMVFDVMAVLASTGEYNFANDEDATYELRRLYVDAKEKANGLAWMQALGAFTLPASPGFDYYVDDKDKTGNLVLLQQMRDEWNEKRSKLYEQGVPNASSKAFRWMLQEYGTDNIFATQSKSRLNVVGLEPTKEMRAFERDNPDVVANLPKTWGLFAPAGGEYDYDAYLAQMGLGYRDPLQPMEMARDAISRRAEHKYDKFRRQVPDVPNRAQSAWLADARRQIAAQFPGSTPGAYGGDEEQVARLAELELAARDPELAKTELGEALGIYFKARDEANKAALRNPEGKSASITSSKETQRLRDWLYEVADDLAAEYDGFSEAWDQVLSREFKD